MSSSSVCPLLLVTGSHDLKPPQEHDQTKHSSLGKNQPVTRKWLIYSAVTKHPEVATLLIDQSLPDLSLASNVHSPGFCEFLNSAFDRWANIPDSEKDYFFAGAGTREMGDVSSFVPAQVAPRDPYQRPGDSVFSQSCYYSMDRLTPIRANTAATLRSDLTVVKASVDALISGKSRFIYALTTEPGHHSSKLSFGGYCYINQSAVAADLLRQKYSKVAVIDVDYHSGNGTTSIFYERDDVFVASLHMDPRLDYPYNSFFADQTGEGKGKGWSMNVCLPSGTDWQLYKKELQKVFDEVKRLGCEAVVVSLGLDTASGDPEASPLAKMELNIPDYVEMGEMFRDQLNLPTIFIQEGGYRLEIVGEAARNTVYPQGARAEQK